jgi:hypothetical protein
MLYRPLVFDAGRHRSMQPDSLTMRKSGVEVAGSHVGFSYTDEA